MRIGPSVQPKVYSPLASQDVARSPRAEEVAAQAVQPLQRQNPALQAFQGQSGFDGPGAVTGAQKNPALKAFQGVSGFDGPGAVNGKDAAMDPAKPPERGPGFHAPELAEYMKVLLAAIGNVAG